MIFYLLLLIVVPCRGADDPFDIDDEWIYGRFFVAAIPAIIGIMTCCYFPIFVCVRRCFNGCGGVDQNSEVFLCPPADVIVAKYSNSHIFWAKFLVFALFPVLIAGAVLSIVGGIKLVKTFSDGDDAFDNVTKGLTDKSTEFKAVFAPQTTSTPQTTKKNNNFNITPYDTAFTKITSTIQLQKHKYDTSYTLVAKSWCAITSFLSAVPVLINMSLSAAAYKSKRRGPMCIATFYMLLLTIASVFLSFGAFMRLASYSICDTMDALNKGKSVDFVDFGECLETLRDGISKSEAVLANKTCYEILGMCDDNIEDVKKAIFYCSSAKQSALKACVTFENVTTLSLDTLTKPGYTCSNCTFMKMSEGLPDTYGNYTAQRDDLKLVKDAYKKHIEPIVPCLAFVKIYIVPTLLSLCSDTRLALDLFLIGYILQFVGCFVGIPLSVHGTKVFISKKEFDEIIEQEMEQTKKVQEEVNIQKEIARKQGDPSHVSLGAYQGSMASWLLSIDKAERKRAMREEVQPSYPPPVRASYLKPGQDPYLDVNIMKM
eukprot:PhF_6_TR31107/c0_g1_i1/m.45509